ncbi:MAG: DNA cytosine methyltransferase [Lentisphaeria bacterium]|nr:MAG: DNA cytosine methyltransferase [Lentisphaeria bacterium]
MLTGGTPCQSFSFAGLRRGLDDPRGNLCLKFAELAHRSSVRWILWENVPGVLSSNGGADFAGFLSLLCGWNVSVPADRKGVRRWKNAGIINPAAGGFGLAWRVLDAQYTRVAGFPRAVPQRRRRVFVVGYRGEWTPAAAVLFDRYCLSWESFTAPPSGAGRCQNHYSKHWRRKCKGTAIQFHQ